MIKDKSVPWSAHGYVPFFNQYKYIKSGLAGPIDDFVKASSVAVGQRYEGDVLRPEYRRCQPVRGETVLRPDEAEHSPARVPLGLSQRRPAWTRCRTTGTTSRRCSARSRRRTRPKDVIPFAMRKEFYRTLGTAS